MAIDISQAEITTRMAIGEPFMIDSQLVQNCRMQIMHVHSILDRLVSERITLPINLSLTESTPRHAAGKRIGVMIAT